MFDEQTKGKIAEIRFLTSSGTDWLRRLNPSDCQRKSLESYDSFRREDIFASKDFCEKVGRLLV